MWECGKLTMTKSLALHTCLHLNTMPDAILKILPTHLCLQE